MFDKAIKLNCEDSNIYFNKGYFNFLNNRLFIKLSKKVL